MPCLESEMQSTHVGDFSRKSCGTGQNNRLNSPRAISILSGRNSVYDHQSIEHALFDKNQIVKKSKKDKKDKKKK